MTNLMFNHYYVVSPLLKKVLTSYECMFFFVCVSVYMQGEREISAIIVTEDYLCYKEPKSTYNFFLILIFNELLKFKISDERQH